MPSSDHSYCPHRSCAHHYERRSGYHISYGPPIYTSIYHHAYPIIFCNHDRHSPSSESDDEYARRKDRKYALLADELKNLKAQRDKVKEWLDGAPRWSDYSTWKKRHEELKDSVKLLEKRVDEERKAVLRRYRL